MSKKIYSRKEKKIITAHRVLHVEYVITCEEGERDMLKGYRTE